MSSHLHYGWRGEEQIGEFTPIGEMSTPSSNGTWTSLIWVTKDVDDVSFTMARMFWSDKQVENLSLINYIIACAFIYAYMYVQFNINCM